MQTIKIKKLHQDAKTPTYGSDGAAAFDLYALLPHGMEEVSIYRGSCEIRTGIAVEVPAGYGMFVLSRSGHGFKENTRLANCVGLIDSDYRGEVMIKLKRDDGKPLVIKQGERIAQAVIAETPKVQFLEVDELSCTERGSGGFGSTGK